jgi:hypothetical protein
VSERNSIDLVSEPRSIIGSRIHDAPRDLVFVGRQDQRAQLFVSGDEMWFRRDQG